MSIWRRSLAKRARVTPVLIPANVPDAGGASLHRWSEIRRVLTEAMVISALGLLVGLAGNAVSPRGLSLTHHYFPPTPTNAPAVENPGGGSTAAPAVTTSTAGRLREKGLPSIDFPEARRLHQDPLRPQQEIVFVDARDDRSYREGHLPGAFQFDRYYPEKHLPVVLPVCLQAAKIVLYCTGGDCEDSEFAALLLIGAGVPKDRIQIYTGGMADWTAKGGEIEAGARDNAEPAPAKP